MFTSTNLLGLPLILLFPTVFCLTPNPHLSPLSQIKKREGEDDGGEDGSGDEAATRRKRVHVPRFGAKKWT